MRRQLSAELARRRPCHDAEVSCSVDVGMILASPQRRAAGIMVAV